MNAQREGTGVEGTPAYATSLDGTRIAYWSSGTGPPLVLVHGAPADHTRWAPLLPHLEPHATVHAIDRRGRGASGDGAEYALEREFEDVAAVVDAVAEARGEAVDLYGHSFGGLCAYGAAPLAGHLRRLVLYEGWPAVEPERLALPPGLADRLDSFLAAGDPAAVVETVFRELVGMADDELDALRALPSWPARVAAAGALPRELRAIASARLDPGRAAAITAPALLLTGSESGDPSTADLPAVAAALRDARVVVFKGQQHVADILAPEAFVEQLVAFLRAP